MSEPAYLKCSCQKCGGHVEFPVSNMGEVVNCPHCNTPIHLMALEPAAIPVAPAVRSPKISRSLVSTISAVFLILILTVTGVAVYRLKGSKPVTLPPPMVGTSVQTNAATSGNFIEMHNFKVGSISLKKTEGSGLVYAVGDLINDTDQQRFGIKIELDMLDDQEKVLGKTSDYLAELEPHKKWSFNALLTVPQVAVVKLADISEQK